MASGDPWLREVDRQPTEIDHVGWHHTLDSGLSGAIVVAIARTWTDYTDQGGGEGNGLFIPASDGWSAVAEARIGYAF